ncbi:MAG TPA: PEGA domain-containing protein [Polyangiaceae bacterium]|nr:PEGA domain-containing protein [Polyangiaceae bacterium]
MKPFRRAGAFGRALGTAACALALLSAPLAHAQGEEEEDPAELEARRTEAKTRYEEGAAAYKEKRYKDAVDLFLEADRILSSAPLSFNIARAYEKLGDNSGALQWYRDYLRRDPQAKNGAEVAALIQALEKKLMEKGVQQLTVRSRPKGATVLIDDQPVGVTPWTGDIPPGKRHVTLQLKGYAETSRELDLPAEKAVDVEVRLVPGEDAPAAPAPVAPPPQAQPRSVEQEQPSAGMGPWPYITLAAGGAVLGGALTFEILRRRAEDEAESDPTQIGYSEKYDTMESRQTIARVLTGVGGALVITGGVLLVLDLTGKKPEEKTGFGFGCDDHGCAASAQGRF